MLSPFTPSTCHLTISVVFCQLISAIFVVFTAAWFKVTASSHRASGDVGGFIQGAVAVFLVDTVAGTGYQIQKTDLPSSQTSPILQVFALFIPSRFL
jgi:hypothetical protein